MPSAITIHLDADSWYKRQESDLSDIEKKYISTAGIINQNKSKDFPKKGHGIYRNICSVINSFSFEYPHSQEIIEHFAYYNFFQRPAEKTGESIKVKCVDKEKSKSVFNKLVDCLKPELIIFTSSLAGKYGGHLCKSRETPYAITPHPTCSWWNRYSKKYAGKGRDVIPTLSCNE